jgi:hypothetical protein
MDVAEWWAGLTQQERDLALRHLDDDPLHPEVVRQLADHNGIMWSEPANGRGERWHWMPEVRDFLAGGCE